MEQQQNCSWDTLEVDTPRGNQQVSGTMSSSASGGVPLHPGYDEGKPNMDSVQTPSANSTANPQQEATDGAVQYASESSHIAQQKTNTGHVQQPPDQTNPHEAGHIPSAGFSSSSGKFFNIISVSEFLSEDEYQATDALATFQDSSECSPYPDGQLPNSKNSTSSGIKPVEREGVELPTEKRIRERSQTEACAGPSSPSSPEPPHRPQDQGEQPAEDLSKLSSDMWRAFEKLRDAILCSPGNLSRPVMCPEERFLEDPRSPAGIRLALERMGLQMQSWAGGELHPYTPIPEAIRTFQQTQTPQGGVSLSPAVDDMEDGGEKMNAWCLGWLEEYCAACAAYQKTGNTPLHRPDRVQTPPVTGFPHGELGSSSNSSPRSNPSNIFQLPSNSSPGSNPSDVSQPQQTLFSPYFPVGGQFQPQRTQVQQQFWPQVPQANGSYNLQFSQASMYENYAPQRPQAEQIPQVSLYNINPTYSYFPVYPIFNPNPVVLGTMFHSRSVMPVPGVQQSADVHKRNRIIEIVEEQSPKPIPPPVVSWDGETFVGEVQFVVAQYRANVMLLNSFTGSKDCSVIVYTKAGLGAASDVSQFDGKFRVVGLPNVGRHHQSYLYHIVNNWDNLAPITIFTRDDVTRYVDFTGKRKGSAKDLMCPWEDPSKTPFDIQAWVKLYDFALRHTHRGRPALFPGSIVHEFGQWDGIRWEWYPDKKKHQKDLTRSTMSPAEVWQLIEPHVAAEQIARQKVGYVPGSIFAVRREDIIARGKEFWETLLEKLFGNPDHRTPNPEVAHIMEKFWLAILAPNRYIRDIQVKKRNTRRFDEDGNLSEGHWWQEPKGYCWERPYGDDTYSDRWWGHWALGSGGELEEGERPPKDFSGSGIQWSAMMTPMDARIRPQMKVRFNIPAVNIPMGPQVNIPVGPHVNVPVGPQMNVPVGSQLNVPAQVNIPVVNFPVGYQVNTSQVNIPGQVNDPAQMNIPPQVNVPVGSQVNGCRVNIPAQMNVPPQVNVPVGPRSTSRWSPM